LKINVVSFAQNPRLALKLINKLPVTLDTLFDIVAVHFVGDKHPSPNIIKSYKLLYVRRFAVQMWLSWLQTNHMGYKDISIELDRLNVLPENNIPESILRAIFKSTDIDKADAEHRTNISNLHVSNESTKVQNENSEIAFDISGVVDLHGTDIRQKEMMSNAISNLNEQKYLSYMHESSPINDYNNPN
jgi:hypothetical protein